MKSIFKKLITAILIAEARLVIRKYQPHVIAITGSVGKTSTKDAIYASLVQHLSVRKSEKSFNSEIGLPLTILGRPNAWSNPLRWIENIIDGLSLILFRAPYPKWLVLEIGADRPGDIRNVARWLPIDIAVITRLPEVPVHVEYFSSPEEVAEEKASIITALKKGGTLIIYADDDRTLSLAARAPEDARTITFGQSNNATVRGARTDVLCTDGPHVSPVGMEADIIAGDARAHAHIVGSVGAHTLLPLIASAAVGVALDIPLPQIIASFESNYVPPAGRMRVVSGIHDSTLIDDSYNASPAAVTAAIETLGSLCASGRKIAVFGDMLELGKYSVDEHRKLGILAAQHAQILVTVGFRARGIAEAALASGMPESQILQFEDAQQAGEALIPLVEEGDVVLIKGSQSMRMERTTFALMRDPQQAPILLVRQEEEWGRR